MEGALIFLGLLVVLNLSITARLYIRLVLPDEESRNEAAVEQAMDRERKEAADAMDEGFENIMRFSVKGKTGFETE